MQIIKQISKRLLWITIGLIISFIYTSRSSKESLQETFSDQTIDSLKIEINVKDSLLKSKLVEREKIIVKDTIYCKEIIKKDNEIIRDFIEIADLRDSVIFKQEAVIQNQVGIIEKKEEIIKKQDKKIKRLRRWVVISSSVALLEAIIIISK